MREVSELSTGIRRRERERTLGIPLLFLAPREQEGPVKDEAMAESEEW